MGRTIETAQWNARSKVFDLNKPFRHFTARMEGRATTGSYEALWEVLPAIHKMVEEYEWHWPSTINTMKPKMPAAI